jgi:hypothetical protein
MQIAGSGLNLGLTGPGIRGGKVGDISAGYQASLIQNYNPASFYNFHGGTVSPPGGYTLYGMFNYGLQLFYAPEGYGRSYGMYIGCPIAGCATPQASYYPWYLKGNTADSYLQFIPNTDQTLFLSALMDWQNTPMQRVVLRSFPGNGNNATLTFNAIDSGGTAHTSTINALPTNPGASYNLPATGGTLALTSQLTSIRTGTWTITNPSTTTTVNFGNAFQTSTGLNCAVSTYTDPNALGGVWVSNFNINAVVVNVHTAPATSIGGAYICALNGTN